VVKRQADCSSRLQVLQYNVPVPCALAPGSSRTPHAQAGTCSGGNLRPQQRLNEEDRQQSVEEFNREDSSVDVMLLSTKAGGLGLTLTGADRAVIYNPSWNPTDDFEAVDRCYRIGQKKSVEVYRFIAAGTVEEKTYEKQIFKDGINRVVTSSAGNKTERCFDKNDLSRLFKLAPPGKCELLEKLQEKGRVGDVSTSRQRVFFAGHKGVIGLSRHDAVYIEGPGIDSSPPTGSSPFGRYHRPQN
jgi:hypothetical protein